MRIIFRSFAKVVISVALLAVLFCGGVFAAPAPVSPDVSADLARVSPPQVDREGAEREFLIAYDFFLKNNMWRSLDDLVSALRYNTYFVDVYLMEALAYRRIGRYPQAVKAMESYLEVRRDDQRARIILDSMKEEWAEFSRILHPQTVTSLIYFDPYRRGEFFNLSLLNQLGLWGIQGLGKLSALGKYVYVPDMLGNNLWVFNRSSTKPRLYSLAVNEPAAVVPLNLSQSLLFQKSGDVYDLKIGVSQNGVLAKKIGTVDANVIDAAAVDASLLAVADRTGGYVKFYGYPSLAEVSRWRPAELDEVKPPQKLFEPIALAVFGQSIAIADRSNGTVHVLDCFTLKELDRFAADKPRDVEWGDQGELYVLGERGELIRRYRENPEEKQTAVLVRGLENAWSMAWSVDGPVIADVGGQVWWNSQMTPGREESIGTISLRDPWITGKKGSEIIHMRGSIGSVFQGYVVGEEPVINVIWRNEVRPCVLTVVPASGVGEVWRYSPQSTIVNDTVKADNMAQVMADIAKKSRAGSPMPRVLVIDSRVQASEGESTAFLAFLLQQGIRLDIWSTSRPASASMTRISRVTRGFTYFAPSHEVVPFDENQEWVLSMPLPVEPVIFGYPSEAMFSLFADVNTIRFRDWLPVWPTLIPRK